jgi:hypothetical protein
MLLSDLHQAKIMMEIQHTSQRREELNLSKQNYPVNLKAPVGCDPLTKSN